MNKIAGQVGIATKEQAEGSRQIVRAVESMNRMTQQVSYATAEQKRGGELVVKAMENISEIARDNLATVEEMSKATAQPRPAGREPGQAHLRLPRAVTAASGTRPDSTSRPPRAAAHRRGVRPPRGWSRSWARRGRAGGDPAAAAGGRRTRAGPCARRPPSALAAVRRRRAAARARERRCATARTRPAQRGHGDLRQAGPRPRAAPCWRCCATPDEEVRNFAAVMLGRAARAPGGGGADRRARGRRRQRAPRGGGQPRPGRRRARGAGADRGPARRSPGSSTRPSTRWARSARRARRPRSWRCSTTSCCAGPCMEALGRLAGREALPRAAAAPATTPTRRCATWPSRRSSPSSSARPPRGESLDPEVQAALRREDWSTTCWTRWATRSSQNRRTAAITLGWLKEPRAERPLIELLPSRRCRST